MEPNTKIIDLSQQIYHNRPVYPGDPEVKIKQVHFLDKEGWNLRTLSITTHLGTHVNAPSHMVKSGESLDEVSLNMFCGKAIVYQPSSKIDQKIGLIFHHQNINKEIANQLIASPPKFVGLSENHEFDIELEKMLLEHNIISYENLANTSLLPENAPFMFYGFPLKIKSGDGSPVRAIAILN